MKVFKEEQRFTQLWLIILLSVGLIVPLSIITQEYLAENSAITTKIDILTLAGILATTLFIFTFKLTTKIDEIGIHYQFFPFHFKSRTISWNDIVKAYVRTYDPIGEYGGWGLKGGAFWNTSKGKCINVSGSIGIQLELKNGKKLLIGTNKESYAKSVLETYQLKINKL